MPHGHSTPILPTLTCHPAFLPFSAPAQVAIAVAQTRFMTVFGLEMLEVERPSESKKGAWAGELKEVTRGAHLQ